MYMFMNFRFNRSSITTTAVITMHHQLMKITYGKEYGKNYCTYLQLGVFVDMSN